MKTQIIFQIKTGIMGKTILLFVLTLILADLGYSQNTLVLKNGDKMNGKLEGFNFTFTQKSVDSAKDTTACDYHISGNIEVFGSNKVERITQDAVTKEINVKLLKKGPYKFDFNCSFSNYVNPNYGKMFNSGGGFRFQWKFLGLKELKCYNAHYSSSIPVDPSGNVKVNIEDGNDIFFYVYGVFAYYEQWWFNDKTDASQSGERTGKTPQFNIKINYN